MGHATDRCPKNRGGEHVVDDFCQGTGMVSCEECDAQVTCDGCGDCAKETMMMLKLSAAAKTPCRQPAVRLACWVRPRPHRGGGHRDLSWRPAAVTTVGVRFLPGFKEHVACALHLRRRTMSRVTLTINLELDTPGLPSCEALGAAMQRAESAAARVFVCGDLGGKMKVDVETSANPIPKTCDAA